MMTNAGAEQVGPGHRGGMTVGYFAGIDVSLETSRVCVVDGAGRIVREGEADSEPEALATFLRGTGLAFERVGLEAGPLSQWLHAGLGAAGLPAVLIETRHVRAALSAMTHKTTVFGVKPASRRYWRGAWR